MRCERNKQHLDSLYPGFCTHQQQQILCAYQSKRWTTSIYGGPQGQMCDIFQGQEGGWPDKLLFTDAYSSPGNSPGFFGYRERGLNSEALQAERLSRRLNLVQMGRTGAKPWRTSSKT